MASRWSTLGTQKNATGNVKVLKEIEDDSSSTTPVKVSEYMGSAHGQLWLQAS
uniref:Uncharacterized protein n=1 Tax=Arundo donax TaxID=35708 RepID=A0A0A9N781_ARUDO